MYTFRLQYPRFLLAEFNTHRVFSRNTSSSRAISMSKMRQAVLKDPFVPIYIGKKQKGMQAGEELSGVTRFAATTLWRTARYPALAAHWLLEHFGVAKQITNRLLEPWLLVVQIASATDLKNFFKLRNHADAEPHFRELARQMQQLVDESEGCLYYKEQEIEKGSLTDGFQKCDLCDSIQILRPGEWHLPFLTADDNKFAIQTQKSISAARAARTSYTLVETGKKSDHESDVMLAARLVTSGHWSPFEHQAVALKMWEVDDGVYVGNFKGFAQFRKEFADEAGGD